MSPWIPLVTELDFLDLHCTTHPTRSSIHIVHHHVKSQERRRVMQEGYCTSLDAHQPSSSPLSMFKTALEGAKAKPWMRSPTVLLKLLLPVSRNFTSSTSRYQCRCFGDTRHYVRGGTFYRLPKIVTFLFGIYFQIIYSKSHSNSSCSIHQFHFDHAMCCDVMSRGV